MMLVQGWYMIWANISREWKEGSIWVTAIYVFSDSRINSVMGTVGFSRDFSETGSIMMDGGIRHTRSEFSADQFQLNSDGWAGWVMCHWTIRENSVMAAWHITGILPPASGLNGAVERNSLTLSTQYRMTYEFSILFSAGYYTNKSDAGQFSSQVIDQRTIDVNPGVRYEFQKNIYLESSYDYTAVNDLAATRRWTGISCQSVFTYNTHFGVSRINKNNLEGTFLWNRPKLLHSKISSQ